MVTAKTLAKDRAKKIRKTDFLADALYLPIKSLLLVISLTYYSFTRRNMYSTEFESDEEESEEEEDEDEDFDYVPPARLVKNILL